MSEELNLHNLKINKATRKKKTRVGRGNATGSGTYSSRGLKGQRSRSGGKGGLKRRGLSQLLKSKPKLGGFKSHRPKMETANLDELEQRFAVGEIVNAKKLISKNIIKSAKNGLKILGRGKLTKKLTVVADDFSKTAKQAIIDAGGKIELVGKLKKFKKKISSSQKVVNQDSK